jgi:cell division protease FtsH
MKNLVVGCTLGFALTVILLFVLFALFAGSPPPPDSAYSEFIAALDGGKIDAVTVRGSRLSGQLKDGHRLTTSIPHPQILIGLTDRLLAKNVRITVADNDPSAAAILGSWASFFICYGLFFGAVWLLMTRPILALVRQLDAYIQAQRAASGTTPPGERGH